MYRYCARCDKTIDFNIKSVKDLDNLICPHCGAPIDKNSRPHPKGATEDDVSRAIGNAYSTVITINYVFTFVIAAVGMVGYFIHLQPMLFIATIVNLIYFTIQFFAGLTTFRTGYLFLTVGAILGAVFLGGRADTLWGWAIFAGDPDLNGFTNMLRGACLGMMIVFAIRFLIRDMIIRFIWFLIGKASNIQ